MKPDLKQHGIFPTIIVFGVTIILLGFAARWYQGMTLASMSTALIAFSEKNVPSLDDPYWKELPPDDRYNSVVRYIHTSERSENWTEQVITVKSLVPSADFAVREAVFDIVSVVHRLCPDHTFQDYGVTRHENGEIYYEWEISGCAALRDRHEIVRLVKRGEVIYGVHHVTRVLPVTSREREERTALLASLIIPE